METILTLIAKAKSLEGIAFVASLGLWFCGYWQWIPLGIMALMAIVILIRSKPLPWHAHAWRDLEAVNNGERRQCEKLQKKIEQALGQADTDADTGGKKSSSMASVFSQTWLNRIFGAPWSYASFDRLLLLALFYPLAWLVLVWLFTGNVQLGEHTVLRPIDEWWIRVPGFALFLGLVGLLPLGTHWALVRWKPHWSSVRKKSVVLVAAVFVFAIAGAGAGAGAFAIAVAFAGAGAFAFAGAGAAFAIAIAVAVAFTVTFAFTVAVAVAVAVAFTVTFAFTVAVAIYWLSEWLATKAQDSLQPRVNIKAVLSIALCLLLLLAASTSIPSWSTNIAAALTDNPTILVIWIFFLGWMPLANALSDWVSLGITNALWHQRDEAKNVVWAAFYIVLDIVAAVGLTVVLFALVLGIMRLMQIWGWPVDAHAVITTFLQDPLDAQVRWLAMLAATNLIPTLWHVVAFFWAFLTHRLLGRVDDQYRILKNSLTTLQQRLSVVDTGGMHSDIILPDKAKQQKPQKPPAPLGAVDLYAVYLNIYAMPWLCLGSVVALGFVVWGHYLALLRWALYPLLG